MTNHKNTERGAVIGGFERRQFSERAEQAFDQVFAYERPLTETFQYAHTMQHGTPEQCAALRVQAIIQEQQRAAPQHQADQQAAAEQQPLPRQQPAPALEQPPAPTHTQGPRREEGRGI